MAKKKQQQNPMELPDSLVPIFLAAWALAFIYISYFSDSALLAKLTVAPAFFLYALYLLFSALFIYKEVEFLDAMGKDSSKAKAKRRQKAPKLSKGKLIAAGISFILGLLLCILL